MMNRMVRTHTRGVVTYAGMHNLTEDEVQSVRQHINQVLTHNNSSFRIDTDGRRDVDGHLRFSLHSEGTQRHTPSELAALQQLLGVGYSVDVNNSPSKRLSRTSSLSICYDNVEAQKAQIRASAWLPREVWPSGLSTLAFGVALWLHTRVLEQPFWMFSM